MTKDVLISFSSIQSDLGGAEADIEEPEVDKKVTGVSKTELVIKGLYYNKNEKHYLLYNEVMEGFKEPVKTKVIFGVEDLEIIRSGPVNVRMFFQENKKNMTSYKTPYGNILLGINTKNMSILDNHDIIMVSVEYTLEADNKPISDCCITIKIQSL